MPSEQSPPPQPADEVRTPVSELDADGDRAGNGLHRRAWRYGELTQADIVAAALRICRREGLNRVTMRKLAAELGLSSMNVYYYVSSKGDLFDLVADAVLGQIPEPPEGIDGWDQQLVFLFREGRTRLLEYPGVSDHLLVHVMGRPNALRLHRILDAILTGAGFSSATSTHVLRVLTYFLFGAVSQELATSRSDDRTDTPAFTDNDAVFDFGLGLMLDGLRARLST